MIERVYVHNFRCFENFSIDFADRPSTLVIGKNGSGKSTLRHTLALFQTICRGISRVRELVVPADFTQHRTTAPMRFEIDLALTDRQYKYTISFEMPETFREARIADESLTVDGVIAFSRHQGQVTLAGGIAFNIDWHVVALPVINERPGENSIRQLRLFLASMILIAPIPDNMSGFSEVESNELHRDASNVSSWLKALLSRYPAAYGTLDTYLKAMIPDFDSFENVPRGESGTQLIVNFQQEEPSKGFSLDFKQLSDGEKCLFLSALIVASNKCSGPLVCFWDEPDNHLSLPEVSHFITQLRRMAAQNGQLIVTSHHPSTIRSFTDDTTLLFARRSHLEPTVSRILSDLEYTGDLVEAIARDEVSG